MVALASAGLVIFVIGLAAASLRLPEWRNRHLPDEAFFAERFAEAAPRAGMELDSPARSALRSRSWLRDQEVGERDTTFLAMGTRAADFLTDEGRGPFVETAARCRWREGRDVGTLRVRFSLHGQPMSASWTADDVLHASAGSTSAHYRERLLRIIALRPLTSDSETVAFGESVHLAPLPGGKIEESVASAEIQGSAVYAERLVGKAAFWRERLESVTLGSILMPQLPELIVRTAFFLGTAVLFFVLLVRRRIELAKGLILGAFSIALSVAEPISSSGSWIDLVNVLIKVVSKGVGLFVLWSAAESWLRSTIPGFRTSLDLLRAGRLGPRGGRAMMAGWSFGAAASGAWLLALSVGTMIPGVSPTDGSVRLPMFGAASSPIDVGAMRTAMIVLAVCVALRTPLIRRIPGSSVIVAALLIATGIPTSPFWASFAVALLLAAILLVAHRWFGLTALLAAGVTSAVLPAAIFSLLHAYWLPWPATGLGLLAVAPLLLGTMGLTRDSAVEEGPLPLPTFVRRLEEENRVKHEMELLARMQLGLLPQVTPVIAGYEIAARSILATEAGGDLYDFLHDAAGRLWIAAGDVSGHGYSCAIAQAMTKAGLASLIEAERTPANVLERLDLVLRGIGSPRTFTTLALLRFDPASGEALVSNAGHPYPWIARHRSVHEIELPSLPLGQGPPRRYADTPLSIELGSVLVFFSDGLFEGTDAAGRAYGFDRIRELLAKINSRPAEAIVNAILEDWRAHVGPEAPEDDTTVVVVKRKL